MNFYGFESFRLLQLFSQADWPIPCTIHTSPTTFGKPRAVSDFLSTADAVSAPS